MNRTSRAIASPILRIFVAIAALFFAIDLIGFSILFGLLGYLSDVARPVAITSAVLFFVGGWSFCVAAFGVLFIPNLASVDTEKTNSTTQIDRLAATVLGSLGGVLVGFVAFVAFWIGQSSIDFALIAFHSILLLFAFGSYVWPNAITEISLQVVDFSRQFVNGILG